jgi:AraC-like DNA-binding protein
MHGADARLPRATGGIARLAYAHAKDAVAPLLKKAGLTPLEMDDANIRLKVRDQIHFLNLAADALADDLLGFRLAQVLDLREVGLLYYVLASSETMSEALQRAARYSTIANEGIALKYIEGGEIRVTFDYVGVSRHQDRHQIEFWVTALVRACRNLAGVHLLPTRIRFVHRREGDRAEIDKFFGTAVAFGEAMDEAAFALAVKQMPVVSADPYLNKFLVTYCDEAKASRPTNRGAFRTSIENKIVPLLPHGKAKLGEVARRVGVSQRTLARRLSAEGMTFSDVLDGLRSDLAERYLADEALSISQIAWLLGYQEVSGFTHAFRRWTGKTPRESRHRRVA